MKGRYPFYPQLDANDCGVACLRMIAAWYGKTVSAARLRLLSHQSTRGVSLLHLAEAAEAIGFQTLAAELTFEQLRDDAPLPAILLWQGAHYVVLYELRKQKAVIADPAEGVRILPLDLFKKHWLDTSQLTGQAKGIVLALEPGPAFELGPADAGNRSLWRWLRRQTASWQWFRWQFWLGMLLSGLLAALVPLLLKVLGDEAIHLHEPRLVTLVLVAWAIVVGLRGMVAALLDWMIRFAGERLSLVGMSQFVGRVLDLPYHLLQGQVTEDLVRRAYGHEQIAHFLRARGYPFLLAVSLLAGAVIALAWIYPLLLLPLVLAVAFELLIAGMERSSQHEIADLADELAERAHTSLVDLLQGLRELKLTHGDTIARWEWERMRNQQFHLTRALEKIERRKALWIELLQQLRDLAMIGLVALAVIQGALTIGSLLAVLWIVSQLAWVSQQMRQFFQERLRVQRWFERVQEVWELPVESEASLRRDPLPEYEPLELDQVSYAWKTGLDERVLDHASMIIAPGATTVVMGSSGSGKSTLIHLLTGLYRPDAGEIRYGSVNLANVSPDLWRRKCSVLLQGSHLFQGTLARNIALGDAQPDPERLRVVARVVRLIEWIDQLPLAFQTVVGEGGLGLSRGKVQQILLARLLYKEAEIYLMDEPLFGLDGPLAHQVFEQVMEFLKGKTVLITSPYELTSASVSANYVLSKGKIRLVQKFKSV